MADPGRRASGRSGSSNGYLTVTYERESAGATANASGTLVDRLTQIAEVRRLGLITEEEFAAQRQRILDSA